MKILVTNVKLHIITNVNINVDTKYYICNSNKSLLWKLVNASRKSSILRG